MAELGSVIVKVGADITDLTKKLDQAGKKTDDGTKLISTRFLAMGAAVAAAAAAAAASAAAEFPTAAPASTPAAPSAPSAPPPSGGTE